MTTPKKSPAGFWCRPCDVLSWTATCRRCGLPCGPRNLVINPIMPYRGGVRCIRCGKAATCNLSKVCNKCLGKPSLKPDAENDVSDEELERIIREQMAAAPAWFHNGRA